MQEENVCSRHLLHHDSYEEISQSPQNRFVHLAAVNRNLKVFPFLPVTGVCFHGMHYTFRKAVCLTLIWQNQTPSHQQPLQQHFKSLGCNLLLTRTCKVLTLVILPSTIFLVRIISSPSTFLIYKSSATAIKLFSI